MNDKLYWMWLSLACSPGASSFSKLISEFKTPKEIYGLSREELIPVIGSRCKDLAALSDKDTSEAERILEFCQSKGVGILVYSDESYPESLRKISAPPPLLYYRGTLPDFKAKASIAVVGTRRLSDYGRKNAFEISKELARSGAIVVSGMAIGIDGVAHAAALSESAPTVAVLGSGIDICYPEEHLSLAKAIVKCGCIFTEYPPKTPPASKNFPVRNRIISGLSEAVVVIEGKERSGTLITARYAKEEKRRVFSLPGNVGNKTSEATNLLIKNGAAAITSASDVISAIEKDKPGRLDIQKLSSEKCFDINEVLAAYSVSALAPGDAVLKPRGIKKSPKSVEAEAISSQKPVQNTENIEVKEPANIPKEALALYKLIPTEGACAIESLVSEEIPLRDVMRLLLKLEIGRFVQILPGERVRRNFQ